MIKYILIRWLVGLLDRIDAVACQGKFGKISNYDMFNANIACGKDRSKHSCSWSCSHVRIEHATVGDYTVAE